MNSINDKNGVLCLTYDDRSFEQWIAVMPLFQKYGAHASFFVYQELSAQNLADMKRLHDGGHTIGLHTLTHADAPEYFQKHGAQAYLDNEVLPMLKACNEAGLEIKSFAYPNNRRNAETDAALAPYFRHFRAGLGVKKPEDVPLQEFMPLYQPMEKLPGRSVMGGAGIGSYYNTKQDEVLAALEYAAANRQVIVLFSHDISETPSRIGTPIPLLEAILKKASELNMAVVGLDELP